MALRRATLALTLTAVLASACSNESVTDTERPDVPYHFTYAEYETVDETTAASSVIVEGTVTTSQSITPAVIADPETGLTKPETLGPDEVPYVATVYNFTVTAVRKGTGVAAGQSIKFTQAGGTYNGTNYGTDEMAPLQPGPVKQVVLLVGTSSADFTLLNPSQGAYNYTPGPDQGAVEAVQPSETPADVAVASNSSELD